jgi:hypothetical protein
MNINSVSNKGLDELKELRDSLKLINSENFRPREETHRYGSWSKNLNDDNSITYSRMCSRCGHIEKINSSVPDVSIESIIKKQIEASRLVDYFCNTDDKDLSDENILFYLTTTIDYQMYMDLVPVINKIISVNGGYQVHNNYTENLIFNSILSLGKIGYIPDDLFDEILHYLNNESEYLGTGKGRAA